MRQERVRIETRSVDHSSKTGSMRLDNDCGMKAVDVPVFDLGWAATRPRPRPLAQGPYVAEPDMQKVIGDRYEPGKRQKLSLETCRAGLYCRRRLDQPALDGNDLLRKVLEEPLERLVPPKEEVPGLAVAVKERAYEQEP
jgi:hypothetical protein